MNPLIVIITIFGVGYIYHLNKPNRPKVNEDEPLIITDYLNRGQADLAREMSRVNPFVGNIESYSGFIRVSDDCVRNMFFWYFPAQNGNTAAPLLVWLQGGPGGSSLFGLLVENGPYNIDSENNLISRTQPWTDEYSVLYIDNPVGTGFSFSKEECYLTNEDDVGYYLTKFMQQFYQLFPNLIPNPLYITGESYAGKYVPAMVNAIHQANQNNPTPMNLMGMAIGNGYSDPYNMNDYGTFLNRIGLIFDNQIAKFDEYRDMLREYVENGNFTYATDTFDKIFSLFYNLTGLTDYYDYYADSDLPYTPYNDFVNRNSRRLHAGNLSFRILSEPVYNALYADITNSSAPVIRKIINEGYKTLFYTGQFDVIVPFPLTSAFLRNLDWNNKQDFVNAQQKIWYSKSGRVNGYVRSAGNVYQVLVRNAGHMVPMDQPEACLDMLRSFVYDLDF